MSKRSRWTKRLEDLLLSAVEICVCLDRISASVEQLTLKPFYVGVRGGFDDDVDVVDIC